MTHDVTPRVSVILPTYNRARFLAQALDSIKAQTWTDWDLIIVDDGSTDDTETVVDRLIGEMPGAVSYVRQANKGAYGARNTGLDHATGTYVAFFDSDDLWLPHHLARCMAGLQAHPELDWVFGSCTRVEHATGRVVDENVFYVDGTPRPFLSLRTRRDGDLRIFDDPSGTECQILHGFFCGLQNSVIHRRIFDGRRFHEQYRVCEDELFLIRVLAEGARLAYYLEPHVIYRMHELNSSVSGVGQVDDKTLAIFRELVDGFEELLREVPLTARDRRAARRRLSREYFWHLGYHGLLPAGRRGEALLAYRQGIKAWPWDWRLWKTYVTTALRPSSRGAQA